jgi:hypothetical protein
MSSAAAERRGGYGGGGGGEANQPHTLSLAENKRPGRNVCFDFCRAASHQTSPPGPLSISAARPAASQFDRRLDGVACYGEGELTARQQCFRPINYPTSCSRREGLRPSSTHPTQAGKIEFQTTSYTYSSKKSASSSLKYFFASGMLNSTPMPGRSQTVICPSCTMGSGRPSTISYHHSG